MSVCSMAVISSVYDELENDIFLTIDIGTIYDEDYKDLVELFKINEDVQITFSINE